MKKLDNIFFFIGIAAFAVMAMQLDVDEVVDGVRRAGYWFPFVIVLWAFLYIINTLSWRVILAPPRPSPSGEGDYNTPANGLNNEANPFSSPRGGRSGGGFRGYSFPFLYKVTVAGFALNYATPGGLMGGEAYRISQLAPRIGLERASASVVLFVMTHIFSHFWFWLVSALIYILRYSMGAAMYALMAAIIAFCLFAIWLFMKGFRNGVVNSLASLTTRIPLLKRYSARFIERHAEKLKSIDRQISSLHGSNRRAFFLAVFLEFSCRVLSSFEIMFILLIITPEITFLDSMLILAFTSLFANMLFFFPLQLGGREGGFMLSVAGLGISASAGVFVALIVRLRELVWTGIGLLLIKVEASPPSPSKGGGNLN